MFLRKWKSALILAIALLFLATFSTLSADVVPLGTTLFSASKPGHSWSQPEELPKSAPAHQCPATPPSPALSPGKSDSFNWRAIPVRYPVRGLSQLPLRKLSKQSAIQYPFKAASIATKSETARRQNAVKETFTRCWKSYKDRAWTKDELAPISGDSRDTFGSWGATLVDSLDTLWIMGMKNEFAEAVDAAVAIEFSPHDDGEINMFEIIIRYLGGFIGAYDVSGCHDRRLLLKAMEVADMAYASFDTPRRMPVSRWSPRRATPSTVSSDRGSRIGQRRIYPPLPAHRRHAIL
jgi:mannosyl-oligosaccharide alpha-1,2-mannosidase